MGKPFPEDSGNTKATVAKDGAVAEPAWTALPSLRLRNLFETLVQIPISILLAVPLFLLALWGISGLKDAGLLNPEGGRTATLVTSLLFLFGVLCYWYLRYIRALKRWLTARAPTLEVAGNLELGKPVLFRLQQTLRRGACLESVHLRMELWSEFEADEVGAVDDQPLLLCLTDGDLTIHQRQFRRGDRLVATGKLLLPSREQWNREVTKLSELAQVSWQAVEAQVVILVELTYTGGVTFGLPFRLNRPENLISSSVLKLAQ